MKYLDEVEIHLSGADVSDPKRITELLILGRVQHFNHEGVTVSFNQLVGEWEIHAPRDWFLPLPKNRWSLKLP